MQEEDALWLHVERFPQSKEKWIDLLKQISTDWLFVERTFPHLVMLGKRYNAQKIKK